MANIKTLSTSNAGKCGTIDSFVGGNTNRYSLFGRLFLIKLNIFLPYDCPLVFIQNDLKIYAHMKTCARIFIAASFIIVNTWSTIKMSFSKWMDKQAVAYSDSGILVST